MLLRLRDGRALFIICGRAVIVDLLILLLFSKADVEVKHFDVAFKLVAIDEIS